MELYKYLYILLFLKIYLINCLNKTETSYINKKDFSIQNAVYIIRNRDEDLNLEYPGVFKNDVLKKVKGNYEIKKEEKEDYYYIKSPRNYYLSSSNNDKIEFISFFFYHDKDTILWKFIPKINEQKKLIYYVQNKKYQTFWKFVPNKKGKNFRLSKEKEISQLNQNNEFIFNELYKVVEKKESELLANEPIDVLIKYIDLRDPNLDRKGIKQIEKDIDNQELKYSVRSILKNIPWIRKIFILMPNEKVKYFLPAEEIKEKIVYVKDKDLLGFESASIYTFHYNLYKMKKFGLSENFILMDDDYFIAQPLDKKDFFYEENGTILPAIITSDYYEMNKQKLQKKLDAHLSKKESSDPHSDYGFYVQQERALLFMYDIFGDDEKRFGKKLVEPAFTHNAIPVKMSDIEEIHFHILNKYEYGKQILTALARSSFDLQMHSMYMVYVKNKYDRKVSKISSEFYDLNKIGNIKSITAKLFVINVSSKIYKKILFKREKQIFESLFPLKTKYEVDIEEKSQNEKDINTIKSIIQNLKNISLIKMNRTKKNNRNSIEKLNDLKEEIITLSGEIKKIIKTYENIKNTDYIYENILNEEYEYIEGQYIFQKKINNILIILVLLFIIIRVYLIINNNQI